MVTAGGCQLDIDALGDLPERSGRFALGVLDDDGATSVAAGSQLREQGDLAEERDIESVGQAGSDAIH